MVRFLTAALALLAAASSISADLIVKRQRPGLVQCAANSYADIPAAIKGCNFVNLYNITVPAGKTIDLRSVLPNSVIFFGREITFLPKKGFKGPLIRFGGSGLYVNGGSGVFDGLGNNFWGQSGSRPVVVSIEGVKNSVFEKLIVRNAPQTAITVTNSSKLTFKGIKITNVAPADSQAKGIVVTNSNQLTFLAVNVTSPATCFQRISGSAITVGGNSTCNGAPLTFTQKRL